MTISQILSIRKFLGKDSSGSFSLKRQDRGRHKRMDRSMDYHIEYLGTTFEGQGLLILASGEENSFPV